MPVIDETKRSVVPDAPVRASTKMATRFRRWRSMRKPRNFRPWMYGVAAVIVVGALFAIGTAVTRPPLRETPVSDAAAPQTAKSGVAGPAVRSDRDMSSPPGGATTIAPQPAPDIAPVPPGPGSLPPKIVKNADIQVQVKRDAFDPAWNRALNVAARYGGFVTNSSTQQTDNRISSGSFTLRVPAPKLEAALSDLRKLGTLKTLTTSGSDISAQAVDLDARIRALQAEQAQLLELLRRVDRVGDILPIRSQLRGVQQELESLRGQKKGLQNQVDYATVNATIFEPDAAPEPIDDGILMRAWRTAVSTGLTIVAGTLVVLGGLVPLALLGLGIWMLITLVRRRRA